MRQNSAAHHAAMDIASSCKGFSARSMQEPGAPRRSWYGSFCRSPQESRQSCSSVKPYLSFGGRKWDGNTSRVAQRGRISGSTLLEGAPPMADAASRFVLSWSAVAEARNGGLSDIEAAASSNFAVLKIFTTASESGRAKNSFRGPSTSVALAQVPAPWQRALCSSALPRFKAFDALHTRPLK